MCETRKSAGNFSTSNSNSEIDYRWVQDPAHTTVISANDIYDGTMFGKTDIPAHNTAYRLVAYTPGTAYPFELWGRTAIGAGCMPTTQGRVNR